MARAAPMTISLEEHLARLLAAIEPLGVRKLVAGWNGEHRPPEKRYGPHPYGLGATIETNCGAVYALDAAVIAARAAIAPVREREGALERNTTDPNIVGYWPPTVGEHVVSAAPVPAELIAKEVGPETEAEIVRDGYFIKIEWTRYGVTRHARIYEPLGMRLSPALADLMALCIEAPLRPALAPAPDPAEAMRAEWPTGCSHPNSCSRNGDCMYAGCVHEGKTIPPSPDAALKGNGEGRVE